MSNIFETTANFETELKNNFLSLKKAYIYKKQSKKIHLADFNYDFAYFYKDNKNFKNYKFAPIENLILKNRHFADLQILADPTKLRTNKSKKERLDTLFITNKKKLFLLETNPSLSIKYKSILAKAARNDLSNSLLQNNSKKELFTDSKTKSFISRGSFKPYKNKGYLDVNFPQIKKNFVKSKKRKYFSFKVERIFGKDFEKENKEEEIKPEYENNREETKEKHTRR